MKISKKNSLLVVLLIAIAGTTQCMNQNSQLGEAVFKGLFGSPQERRNIVHPGPNQPSPFAHLPKEMQNEIFGWLIANSNQYSLQESTEAIDALALVNKELNQLFSNPQFCLKIIKELAKNFNMSDEKAASYLSLKAAKERVALQKKLRAAIESKKSSTENLLSLIQQGADVNFTVTAYHVPTYWFPLAQICITESDYDLDKKNEGLKKLAVLLKNGSNPKLRNSLGETAIEIAKKYGNKEAIELLEKYSQ